MAEPLGGVFRRPFEEQVAALRLRLGNLVGTRAWDDLRHEAHDRAFVVAGAVKADLLEDLGEAVRRSIEDGASLEEFRRDFRAIVERRGWHGWTGEGSRAGEAWRTRVIYKTNMATSYAAGRMAQLRAAGFDLWVYRHGASREPRPQHLAWDRVVLPADHPFWATHYPPNGWGCSCYVTGARSEAGARRVGGDPDKALPEGWQTADPRTGAPRGIDKGWGYAPGASVADAIAPVRPKLAALPPEIARSLLQELLSGPTFARWLKAPAGEYPLARIPEADAERIGSRETVAHISAQTAEKQARNHPELTSDDYALAQRAVDEATRKLVEENAGGTRSMVYLWAGELGGTGYFLVVKTTLSGGRLYVTSFRRISREAGALDAEVQRLLNRRASAWPEGEG